nr:hypothetical protein [uncultured Faecalibacillus sp.]
MNRKEVITIVVAILSSGVINIFITNILYGRQLRKELKQKGNDKISQDIEKSLQYYRELELKLKTQEIFNFEDRLKDKNSNINMFEGEVIYPEVLNDFKTMNEFIEDIQICRKEHEKNFSCRLALYLVYIDRYFQELRLYLATIQESEVPLIGTVLIFDLQEWQKKVDKLLVKEINKHNYKLESHETIKWRLLRKRILKRNYENSFLYYFRTQKPKKSRKLKKIRKQNNQM